MTGYNIPAGTYVSAQTGTYVYSLSASTAFTNVALIPLNSYTQNIDDSSYIYPLTISSATSQYTSQISAYQVPLCNFLEMAFKFF